MKVFCIFCLAVAVAVPQFALAKLPFTPQALGQVEGTLKFCSKTNPAAEAKYKEFGKVLVRDASEKELTEVRNSDEYKESFDSITEQLSKVPKQKAVEACSAFLEEKK